MMFWEEITVTALSLAWFNNPDSYMIIDLTIS